MTDSSKKKYAMRGGAMVPVIALALGTAGVFSSVGPGVNEAQAVSFSGGIRDKSGAVEEGEQMASGLPAGTCSVEDGRDDTRRSHHGFTWHTYEPYIVNRHHDPNKTKWGVGIAFDNSGGRTFAGWHFSNSGLMGGYLETGEVPALSAGQSYLTRNAADWTATHKADESIDIDSNSRQRNLNLYGKLTDEKVRQYAQATADNPVRYAWEGEYTQEYPDPKIRATQGNNVTFSATFNPWPSENIECNPITVSWENFEKLSLIHI